MGLAVFDVVKPKLEFVGLFICKLEIRRTLTLDRSHELTTKAKAREDKRNGNIALKCN